MTSPPFYHAEPELMTLETVVCDARPGKVRLATSPFYPGGGGQLADRGRIRWGHGETSISGIEQIDGLTWLCLTDTTIVVEGCVEAVVDRDFRQMMSELHTATHILNALVYSAFDGALVTGAQLGEDGTARIDFDLPDADSDRLRALEAPMVHIIRENLGISTYYVSLAEAVAEQGLIRSKSVAPPPNADGQVRIVDVQGLDRQACGGTHLTSTGTLRPIRITKIDNKGRHNRRVRIALD